VPLVVAAEEAARKFTLPPKVAEAAERNAGSDAWACAVTGASQTPASSARLTTAFMAPSSSGEMRANPKRRRALEAVQD
jgi:hypothetical protein